MFKKRLIVGIALGLLSAMSCTKKGDTGPAGANGTTGPAGPSYTGTISGHVMLFDQYGSRVTNNLSAAQVAINGNYMTATKSADTSGYYVFDSTKTGTYSLSAQIAGYGSANISSFQFLSGNLNRDIKMSAIPDFAPNAFSVLTTVSGTGDSLVLAFTPDTRIRNCIVLLNKTAVVTGNPSDYLLAYTKAIPANVLRAVIVIPKQDLTDVGLTSGSTIYLAAFGYPVNDASAYEDVTTGKIFYDALSTAPLTATAIVP